MNLTDSVSRLFGEGEKPLDRMATDGAPRA